MLKHKEKSVLFVIYLLTSIVLTSSITFTRSETTTVIYMDPPTLIAFTGNTFTVAVTVANVTNLHEWEFNLTFNSFVMQCEGIQEGPFLKDVGATIFPSPTVDNENGLIRAGCALINPSLTANGTGVLAYITFLCTAPEQGSLIFTGTLLLDPANTPIPHTSANGAVLQIGAYLDSEEPITPTHVHSEQGLIDPYMPPIGTTWHEIYPEYCIVYNLTSWEDNGDDCLSPSDQIDMINVETGEVKWYHVDHLTITLMVSEYELVRYIEFIGPYSPEIINMVLQNPVCTYWHEVIPQYSNIYHIVDWSDNGDGILSYCDYIIVNNTETGEISEWHVEYVATDIILTEKVSSPYCTYWHELYPTYCLDYHVIGWDDNGDGLLSPCDKIELQDTETMESSWYHVEDLTLTFNLSGVFLEFTGGYSSLYEPIINPVCTYWHEVYPEYCREYHIIDWIDNGDCILSACDTIGINDTETGEVTYYHVDEICYDLLVSPTSPPWYVKSSFSDYAPSGMPDFDQRQDKWYWRAWAFPDAIAVWQHNNAEYNDWDIYYSIYTDPNMWWTLGCQNARPIVADSLSPGPATFLPGDDLQPAISWYSSNYSIVVWQHFNYTENDWDIWYSLFTPNIGWTWPAPVAQIPGADEDPAIAFDTNGWAVCIWVHTNPDNTKVIYYSLWNPATLSWVGPAAAIAGCFGNAWMPEVDIDSQHNVVAIWTDGPVNQEVVWYSWAPAPPPAPIGWSAPVPVPNCPRGINWQKGLSPDNLGNNLMTVGYTVPWHLLYGQFSSPDKIWTIPASNFTMPPTFGEHPDVAVDLNNNAIAVYSYWPGRTGNPGEIRYSFWNGAQWTPINGSLAATTGQGIDQWPAIAFIRNNKAVLVWQAYPEDVNKAIGEIYYSVYTPPYPPGSWSPPATIVPNILTGSDYYVDIASPTGSPTTPPSVPPPPSVSPVNPVWTYCGPVAVANSIWWFDSKYEPNNVPPPIISDGFPLVKSYNPGVWDDHDPRNVQPFIAHLAWLMDTDGQRTGLCHQGTSVWDMQAGITQYLSWSGVNPLGDVNGDGVVNQTDVNLVNAAMNSKPGDPNWNLAADIWPETITGPGTADNVVDSNDLALVTEHLGEIGMFYEHTTDLYPDFFYIEEEVEKSQDVVILLGFYYFDGTTWKRDGGHFVTVAGVNSTTQELLISNPIRDEFEAGRTSGESPVPHPYPHNSTVHNNASLVSHDVYRVYNAGGYWALEGYFDDPSWEARIEYAVVTSPLAVHDVAVVDVKPWKTVVGQTYTCNINVTVTNEGNFTEMLNVTLYANATIIETLTDITLTSGNSTILTFVWNTTGWSKGNYTISAYAWPVPGETDTADNTFTDGWIIISIVGDITGGSSDPWDFIPDGKVSGTDITIVCRCFGSWPQAQPPLIWHPNADINNNQKVDGTDITLVCYHFGQQDP